MNIIHRTSKNADYYSILEYYTERHSEDLRTGHYEPLLDEHGLRQPRENCRTIYINSAGRDDDPEHFARDCLRTDRKYGKNRLRSDIKSHEYILSHDAADRPKMTDADLEREARAWVKRYGTGYQVLISIHRDTDNDHIHITLHSVRDGAREPQDWMQRNHLGEVLPCEIKAGGKHQQSVALRCDMNEWALAYAREHHLLPEDNNQKAREHTAQRYSERNAYLRNAVLNCAAMAHDQKELRQLLSEKYGVELIIRGKTISLKHPEATKATRLRSLGLTPQELIQNFDKLSLEQAQLTGWEQDYIHWIYELRRRNSRKAEEALARAEEAIYAQLKARGERYSRENYQDLYTLLRQCSYLSATLEGELIKTDRLLEKWDTYTAVNTAPAQRSSTARYLRWAGCDPDSSAEHTALELQRNAIELERSMAEELKKILLKTAEEWKGHNELDRAMNDLNWGKIKEDRLRHEIKYLKKRCRKLSKILYNCEQSATRYTGLTLKEYSLCGDYLSAWEPYGKYARLWTETTIRRMELEQELVRVKQNRINTKQHIHDLKQRDLQS